MKKELLMALTGTALLTGTAFAGGDVHWGYSGDTGPEFWGSLTPAYSMCAYGKNQSPVNLTGFVESALDPVEFSYTATASNIVNNGHAIQADFPKGSSISVDDTEFDLLQCHYHSPSENHINGQSFPMEGHCVHADHDGNLAVVTIMYELGEKNPGIAKLWQQMPLDAGEKQELKQKVNALDLMPEDKDYYRFSGSLTTPPCSEGVRWLVLKETATVSREQVETFTDVMHHPNNRPIQPLNARKVMK